MISPILAEIADKMPSIRDMWDGQVLLGSCFAAMTFTFAFVIKRPFGALAALAVILPVAWLCVMLSWPDPLFDPIIVRELGTGYLWHQRLSALTPAAMALAGGIVGLRLSVHRHRLIAALQSYVRLESLT